MRNSNSTKVFYTLVRAGLWESDVQLSSYGEIDYENVLRLAGEQSLVGLVAAGLEHVKDLKVPQQVALALAGEVLQLEQRNKAMNQLISQLICQMRREDIYTLIVKGQGVAQCYERPLWRVSGDVDFYMSEDNFLKARDFFKPQVSGFTPNNEKSRRIEINYGHWVIELHANQRISLSAKANKVLGEIHHDLFYGGSVRSWDNNGTTIFLPSSDNDVIIIFTHFLNHFYKGGIGLRQICDWCRLLYTFKDSFDKKLLENRLRRMGLVAEWKAFAVFAVEYLGMPSDAMPLYEPSKRMKRKAGLINGFIMEVGNFGHNRNLDYYVQYPYLIRKVISMQIRIRDIFHHARIFPVDTIRFFTSIMIYGLRAAIRGE